MKPRQIALVLILVVTLVAAFWPRSREDSGVAVVGAVAKRDHLARVAREEKLGEPPHLGAMQADLFPAQSWRPPPPPPPKFVAPPPPPPMAPPLPFQYLGRWQEGDKDVIFLAQGNNVLNAQAGDVVAGWRLDQASDSALTFTWTALNLQQTLRIAP